MLALTTGLFWKVVHQYSEKRRTKNYINLKEEEVEKREREKNMSKIEQEQMTSLINSQTLSDKVEGDEGRRVRVGKGRRGKRGQGRMRERGRWKVM